MEAENRKSRWRILYSAGAPVHCVREWQEVAEAYSKPFGSASEAREKLQDKLTEKKK